ncbi:unnamed protein product, partial [Prorocentrum cordatum]
VFPFHSGESLRSSGTAAILRVVQADCPGCARELALSCGAGGGSPVDGGPNGLEAVLRYSALALVFSAGVVAGRVGHARLACRPTVAQLQGSADAVSLEDLSRVQAAAAKARQPSSAAAQPWQHTLWILTPDGDAYSEVLLGRGDIVACMMSACGASGGAAAGSSGDGEGQFRSVPPAATIALAQAGVKFALGGAGSTCTAPMYARSIEGGKVCLECADKTGRVQTRMLSQCPQHARDGTAVSLKFLHPPFALRTIVAYVDTIAGAEGAAVKLNVALQEHPGHPTDLIGDSFNLWKAQKKTRQLRNIAANSRYFLSALSELGHKGGMISALFAASAEEMEGVLAASPGWRSFKDASNDVAAAVLAPFVRDDVV